MNWNKRITEGAALFVCGLLLTVATSLQATSNTNANEISNQMEGRTAGIIASMEETEGMFETDVVEEANISIARTNARAVTTAYVTTSAAVEVSADAVTMTEEEKEWQDKVMADVEDSLSIREEASKESKIVGKLFPNSVARVIEKNDDWTLIKSGRVKGYVRTKYCIFGSDAYAHMLKVCKEVAVVEADILKVREEATKDSKVVTIAPVGTVLSLNQKAEMVEGWVAVKTEEGKGYVAEQHVEVKYDTTRAMTLEEIEEAARKAEEASRAYNATAAERELLATIIHCEACGDTYEGQVAVGAVVMNRVRSSRFPNDIKSVIYQRGQFGPAGSGKLARYLGSGKVYESCYRAADDALAGVDNTGGRLFFNTVGGTSNVIRIGAHRFW